MRSNPAVPGGSLKSKPTWSNTSKVFHRVGFFWLSVTRHVKIEVALRPLPEIPIIAYKGRKDYVERFCIRLDRPIGGGRCPDVVPREATHAHPGHRGPRHGRSPSRWDDFLYLLAGR